MATVIAFESGLDKRQRQAKNAGFISPQQRPSRSVRAAAPRHNFVSDELFAALMAQLSLQSQPRQLRLDAAIRLGELYGHPKLQEIMLPLLDDEDSTTRSCAALAIGYPGNLRAIFPLLALLDDEDFSVRDAALLALGGLRDSRVMSFVLEALERDARLLKTGLQALRLLNAEQTEPIFRCFVSHNDDDVALLALGAYLFVNDVMAADIALVKLQSHDDRQRLLALQILANWGRRQDLEAIFPLLQDATSKIRHQATICIQIIRSAALPV